MADNEYISKLEAQLAYFEVEKKFPYKTHFEQKKEIEALKATIADLNEQIKLLEEFALFKRDEQEKSNLETFVKSNPLTKKTSVREIKAKTDGDEIPPIETIYN